MKFSDCPPELLPVPGYPGVFIPDLAFDELKQLEQLQEQADAEASVSDEDDELDARAKAEARMLEHALYVWKNVLVGSDGQPFEDMQTVEQVRAKRGGIRIMSRIKGALNPQGE